MTRLPITAIGASWVARWASMVTSVWFTDDASGNYIPPRISSASTVTLFRRSRYASKDTP